MKPMKFTVTLVSSDDAPEHVVIDAQVTDEISGGFIATESVNDIFALRDALDAFISKHQISRIISHG